MSSHSYRTTTVEYYEYLVPEFREIIDESVLWPLQAAVSNSYVTRPLSSVNYLTGLQDHMAMTCGNNQHSDLIYDVGQCRQRQTIIEYSEPEESDPTSSPPNPRYENHNERDIAKEYETGNENRDSTVTEPISNKKRHGKNIYQAKQGYLVEEPTSESEEDDQSTL